MSRTLIFPFKLSNVILRHSSFPHTNTFSAFEVSHKNVLHIFTVIIIIIIIIILSEINMNILQHLGFFLVPILPDVGIHGKEF